MAGGFFVAEKIPYDRGHTKEKNRQLRVKPVLHVECGVIFLDQMFVFGFCITFMFKSYFYDKRAKR
jgi:hypothetical protein